MTNFVLLDSVEYIIFVNLLLKNPSWTVSEMEILKSEFCQILLENNSLLHSFNKYLLNTCYVPGITVGAWFCTSVYKTKILVHMLLEPDILL